MLKQVCSILSAISVALDSFIGVHSTVTPYTRQLHRYEFDIYVGYTRLFHRATFGCFIGIHSTASSGYIRLFHWDTFGCFIGIHSAVSSGYIRLFHRDTFGCFIGIHSDVSSGYIRLFHRHICDSFIRFFENFCNVSAISAATTSNADCIDTHFVQQWNGFSSRTLSEQLKYAMT